MRPSPLRRQLAAWLVHLYTASGGVVGVFALYAAAERETRTAFLLLVLSTIIDATDGLLARRVKVWEVLPNISGARMDDVIDSFTFIWIAAFIMWREALLPHPAWTVVPVLAGLYAYAQTDMKSEENFFIGFPSYWSTIALYLFWLRPEALIAVLLVVVPGILSFIPTRYLYPSKNQLFWRTSWLLGALWFAMIIYLLFQESPPQWMVLLSLFYPIYYLSVSFYIEYRLRYTAYEL